MIPNLGHMLDLRSLEEHHINVFRSCAFTGGLQSSCIFRASVRPLENGTCTNCVSLLVLTEAEQLVTSIRHNLVDGDHELRIVLEGGHPLQCFILA